MEEFYVDRYLCPKNQHQNLDSFSFLLGELNYVSPNVIYSMDVYKKFNDIKDNPYNFIVGNGGLGKSTYLKQVKKRLNSEQIPCLMIELKTLTDEVSLYDRISNFCKENKSTEIYLLLDAVDEAIDCNVKNVANKIGDALSKVIGAGNINGKLNILSKNRLIEIIGRLKNKKQRKFHKHFIKNFHSVYRVKTIITCRDNRVPDELIPILNKVYKLTEDNIFYLCRLMESDAIQLAKNMGCNNTDDFMNKVKEYNIGSFASSPITLKPLVNLYMNNELDNNSNNYDIFEILMRCWCEESDYRKNKAINNEDNFKLKPTDEILFVASKIAIEMKLSGKNELSYNNASNAMSVEDFYNLTFDLPCGKKIIFTKELVDYTLKTKIFCKNNNNFSIEQQTYKDFLVARYLFQMQAKEKDLFRLLKIGKDFHPNFTECLAYLSVKNDNIFKVVLKEIPERILLSSVYFCKESQKEDLFKVYLKCVKKDTVTFWSYSPGRMFFNKKLFYSKLDNILKNKIKTKDSDIKKVVIDIIWDNRRPGYESEFKNIIFDTSENTRIKVLAIYASKDCLYDNLLKEIAENLNKFTDEVNKDIADQLRGALLNCLYPDLINTETMLSYLKEPVRDNFYGYYRDFLKYKLSKSVNENNADMFLDWIIQNRNMREIVKESHGEGFSRITKEIFKRISEFLNFDLITKYISLQLAEKYAWQIVSDDIINKILERDDFRRYFIDQLIERSSNIGNFRIFLSYNPNFITTYEIPLYLNKYANEKDEFRKNLIEIVIKNTFREYLSNNLTDDIDNIYNTLQTSKELKYKFGYFINAVAIDPKTLEPINEVDIFAKKDYYANLKNKEKNKQHQQRIQELNNFPKQLNKILGNYKKNKNLQNTVFELFSLLNLEKESLYYHKNISIVLDEHTRWKDVPENKQQELIDIFKKFLFIGPENGYTNIDNYISKNKFNIYWNCLGFLPLLKESDLENYNKLLQDWVDVIIYISAASDVALKLKQELIKDLYTLNSELVHKSVLKIITKTSDRLSYNFLRGLELIWDNDLALLLFDLGKSKVLNEEIKTELIQFLSYHQYKPIEGYIKTCIQELLKAKEIDNNKVGNLLNILFYGFGGKSWKYIKNLIYKNKIPKETFLILISKTASQNIYANDSMYKLLNSKELIELYKWLIKKYPEINQSEYKTGFVHNTDWLKDFTEHIPDYFITSGNVDAYKKIKNSYLKNRKNKKDYQKSYNRNLKLTKYNYVQNIKIDYSKLTELEKLYYKEKKEWINMKIGKYIFGDNNTNYINENCNNKNIKKGVSFFEFIFKFISFLKSLF